MNPHFTSINNFNDFINVASVVHSEEMHVLKYDEHPSIRLASDGITTDFYFIAYKKNMNDLNWYGNTKFDEKAGFLYFMRPHQLHAWNASMSWKGYHMLLVPSVLTTHNIHYSFFTYGINKALFLTPEEQSKVEILFEQIYEGYHEKTASIAIIMAYCNVLFTYIQECYKRQFNTREPLYNTIINDFNNSLNNHYKQNPQQLPSVKYFAQKLHLTSNYLGDLIKHYTGKSAIDTIHDKVIFEAKNLLDATNKPVSEIGYSLGFEYPTYFSRMFKKHTGLTPSQYRKK